MGFGSGEPEHALSRSKYLKVPLVEDSRTRKESLAARGLEEQVQFRGTDHADVGHGGANRFVLNGDRRSLVRIVIKQPGRCKKEIRILLPDPTETIKEETMNRHQSSIDQTCV